ncbi:helix-turn-helix domain-containing protein [Streptomyces sp. NPDC127072]|uniref:helix-turn-helix domain-containing protein n=1 Tax=Streptomyces sp. NPDC127072 TaxID=3347129 RepID=UPI00365AF5AE
MDVTTPAQAPPLQQLLDRDLLLRLMKRTGQGDAVDVRKLARRAGIARGTVGDLVSGARSRVTYDSASAISAAIGVDLEILFASVGRSLAFIPEQPSEQPIAVSA